MRLFCDNRDRDVRRCDLPARPLYHEVANQQMLCATTAPLFARGTNGPHATSLQSVRATDVIKAVCAACFVDSSSAHDRTASLTISLATGRALCALGGLLSVSGWDSAGVDAVFVVFIVQLEAEPGNTRLQSSERQA